MKPTRTSTRDTATSVDRIEMLQFGSLSIQFGEKDTNKTRLVKKALGICGESSITLVKTKDGSNILIDTGFRNEMSFSEENMKMNEELVISALHVHGLKPADIHEIFITHFHHDHFGNVRLFPSAIVRVAGLIEFDVTETLHFYEMRNKVKTIAPGMKWHPGMSVLATPGHNKHHHSVVLTLDDLTIVAAGDAIVSQSYYDNQAVWTFNGDFMSEPVALASMDKVIQIADIIIPGHGQPFQKLPLPRISSSDSPARQRWSSPIHWRSSRA